MKESLVCKWHHHQSSAAHSAEALESIHNVSSGAIDPCASIAMAEAFYISGSNVEMFGAAWFSDSTCLPRNYCTIKLRRTSSRKAALAKLHSGSHFVSFSTSIARITSLAQIAEVTCTVKQWVDCWWLLHLYAFVLKYSEIKWELLLSLLFYHALTAHCQAPSGLAPALGWLSRSSLHWQHLRCCGSQE